MRKQIVFFAAALLFSLSGVLAAPTLETEPKAPFTKQLIFLLSQDGFESTNGELQAKVLLTFDAENRIEILEIESEDQALSDFIRQQLEGSKIYVDQSLRGRRYVLPLRVTA